MARATLKRMRTFIEMHNMQDTLTVRKCTDDKPADRYVLGKVVGKGYQVNHKVGEDDYYVYVCKTLTAAAECINHIIYKLPMDDNVTPYE